MMMDDRWPEAAWIERGDGLAAFAPQLHRVDHGFEVSWREAGHERRFMCYSVDDSQAPERIAFVDERRRLWVLRELTLERYNEHVRMQTIGRPVFKTREEMIAAMQNDW